jgi:hypothetical protein
MTKETGGPAFPFVQQATADNGAVICFGMDLRDYFAAKAMQGFHANTNSDQLETETYEEYVSDLARCAYQQADAMLKAREV